MNISNQELNLFARQLILKEFNEKVFEKIQSQHVTLVGLGGIGCPAAQYLLATGVKKITLIDGDIVQLSNLNRQILYSINDIGKKKVDVAKIKLQGINPNCQIVNIPTKLTEDNLHNSLMKSSLVIDTTDNWSSMLLINEYCVQNFIPLISSSVVGYDGQVILFKNKKNHHLCLNCIYPNKDEPDIARCDRVGILGTTAGLTGLTVAQTVINFFTNSYENFNKLIMINSKTLKIDHIKVKENIKCICNKTNS